MNTLILSKLPIVVLVFISSLLGVSARDKVPADGAEPPPPIVAAQLFEGMGAYQRKFTTESDAAANYLNQAMIWLQAFNHDEARRAFLKAAELDPWCAWAWWGVAYCEGPNYNDPEPDENRKKAGWYAIQNAIARSTAASEVERALIEALATRYSNPWPQDFSEGNKRYASAMAEVWERFPKDADVGAFYAEAMMQLRPWQLYSKDRKPAEGTVLIRETLDKVLKLDPDHAGANHLYIHAVEPSEHPDDAKDAARALEDMVPASGHLQHMPSHIYVQTGEWERAIDRNKKAVAADIRYRERSAGHLQQYAYQAHNAHMLVFAAMMTGQEKLAAEYGEAIWDIIPESEMEEKGPAIDFSLMCKYDVMKRFGRWDKILAEEKPPEFLPLTTAFWRSHRAIAHAAKKEFHEAEREYAEFMKAKFAFPEKEEKSHNLLKVSEHFIRAEIALQKEEWSDAISHLERAVQAEDLLPYAEPPVWLQPVRHTLGAVYMKIGEFKKAEKAYQDDLMNWPENGWSLFGLSEALRKQGQMGKAREKLDAYEVIWEKAEEPLDTTCICIPDMAGK